LLIDFETISLNYFDQDVILAYNLEALGVLEEVLAISCGMVDKAAIFCWLLESVKDIVNTVYTGSSLSCLVTHLQLTTQI